MNVLVLAAGGSDAFEQAGASYPKNLVEIAEKSLIQHVLERLAPLQSLSARFIVLIPAKEDERFFTGSVVRLIDAAAVVQTVPHKTAGAACTALLAVDHINTNAPLLIVNGDMVMDIDPSTVVRDFEARQLDAGILIFEGLHPRWSYVRLDADGFVMEAAEKRPISRNATTGFTWFARGSDFVAAAASMLRKAASIDGVFYIAPVLNELILRQARIGVTRIAKSQYHSLKDPAGARAWEESLREQGDGGQA